MNEPIPYRKTAFEIELEIERDAARLDARMWRGIAIMMTISVLVLGLLGCDVEDVERSGTPPLPPAADVPVVAEDPDTGWCWPGYEGIPKVGCAGWECAHGFCWEGECVGLIDGVDPGVCCLDEECDAG